MSDNDKNNLPEPQRSEFWIMMFFKGSIGEAFEIVSSSRLLPEPFQTLKVGSEAIIKHGVCKSQGTVVYITEMNNEVEILQEVSNNFNRGNQKNSKHTDESAINIEINVDPTEILGSPKKEVEDPEHTSETEESNKNILSEIQNNNDVVEDNNRSNVVYIGPGRTEIPLGDYLLIQWNCYRAATRKLLMAVFDRNTLATHSLTGRPSAYLGRPKPRKARLDQIKIADIVETVSTRCSMSPSVVRSVITTKCTDENKMLRQRLRRQQDKENQNIKPVPMELAE